MNVQQLNEFPCPICRQPLAIPHAITLGPIDRAGRVEVKVDIDREKVRGVFEAHCLATPDEHRGLTSDDASPDTSQEYFLDLLRRIDDATDTGREEES